ncbi:MAG TPA: oligosaccharide flippase family protein [Myxococcales bacterium]|nr:oligosaccharide flippase family protein [Myxococcales bacterium]
MSAEQPPPSIGAAARLIFKTGLARLYSLVISMGTLIVVARLLGPSGRGAMAAIISWVTLLSSVGSLSLGQIAIHRAARHRGRPWLSETMGSLLGFTALLSALGFAGTGFAFYLGAAGPLKDLPPAVCALGVLQLPLVLWDLFGSSLLIAVDALLAYNRALIIGRTLSLLALLVFVPLLGFGVNGALLASLLGQFAVAALAFRSLLVHADGPLRPSASVTAELIGGGARLHFSALGLSWVNSATALLVQTQRGAAQTGFFTLANDMAAILIIFSQATLQMLSSDAAVRGPAQSWQLTKTLLPRLLAVTAAIMAVSALLARPAVALVLGAAYADAVPLFQILLLTLLPQTFAMAMAPQWVTRGLFWQSSAGMMLVAALNLFLARLWVPLHGATGAVWASVAAFALVGVINLGFVLWISRASTRATAA